MCGSAQRREQTEQHPDDHDHRNDLLDETETIVPALAALAFRSATLHTTCVGRRATGHDKRSPGGGTFVNARPTRPTRIPNRGDHQCLQR
jgi:hypothetical protein